MSEQSYQDFFLAIAGATGALIGLLFVAVSVSAERATSPETRADYGSRAATALLLFTNVLVLSLAGLVPGVSLGWWAVVAGITVFVFGAATARLVISSGRRFWTQWRSIILVVGLLAIAVVEVHAGIDIVQNPGSRNGLETLDYLLIAEVAAGIARAWELVGLRDTGIIASLTTLARGDARTQVESAVDPDSSQEKA
ncbi:MAG TPA: hypothetical protein VHX15_07830 [Frankiaceae bacterium]|nr:hypothetical protein [Frankiaceae bacterium]